MNPLLQEFIAESRQHIEQGVDDLAVLRAAPDDGERLNSLFRAFHTIKGSCRLFGLEPIVRLVSAAEDLLDSAREHEIGLERHHFDLLLHALDVLEGWFDELEQAGELGVDAATTAAALAGEIRQAAGQPAADTPATASRITCECGWLSEVDETLRERLFSLVLEQPLVAVLYEPEADCFYAGEDPLYDLRALPGLLGLAATPRAPWPPLAELDVFRCHLRLFAFSGAPPEDVERALQQAAGLVAIAPIERWRLAVPAGTPATTPAAAAAAQSALHRLDDGDLAGTRESLAALPAAAPWLASARRWLTRLTQAPVVHVGAVRGLLQAIAAGRPAETGVAPPGDLGGAAARALAVRKLLQAQLDMLGKETGSTPSPGRLQSAATVAARCAAELDRQAVLPAIERAARDGDVAALRSLLHELSGPAREVAETVPGEAAPPVTMVRLGSGGAEHVRIELRQVDRLMDLIGEMVVAKNGLPYLAQQAEAQGLRAFARGLKERYAAIHRVVEEMQATIAAVRMVPLAQGFRRLPRLVRDAARRVRKEVRLEVEGDTVEADRRVVDALGEPLVHLVRNAVDHGLEAPEQRAAAGKPTAGLLRVTASIEGERLVLAVADDGRGVDLAAVKRRAYERGLIDEEALSGLSDEGAVQLVFQPGFSTRGTVTEMSGRGVGLDVVRNAAQALGGSVALSSRPGLGTRVVLTVPLSLATAEVMLVEAGGQNFGVPVAQIAQTFKLGGDRVLRVRRRRAFILRGEVVPLFDARGLLGLSPAAAGRDRNVLVARLDGRLVGFEVDRFGDVTEVVMKPLDGWVGGLPHYAGSAVLADGAVLLVLDLPRLVRHAADA